MTRAIFITTPDELDALGDALEAMLAAKPETGEQWAEICALEEKIEKGIFRDHNCWKCRDGAKPCVNGHPHKCEFPHAKND